MYWETILSPVKVVITLAALVHDNIDHFILIADVFRRLWQ